MAYGYNYGGYPIPGAGMYAPPMQDQLAQLRGQQGPFPQVPPVQQQAPPQNGINWVQGEEGARAYMVAPGCTVLLMDSDGCSFYLKSADASGMPQPLRVFDYIERKQGSKGASVGQSQAVDEIAALRADLDALKARCASCHINTRPGQTAQSSAILGGSEGAQVNGQSGV